MIRRGGRYCRSFSLSEPVGFVARGKCRGSLARSMSRQDDPEPVQLTSEGFQMWARSVCGRVRGENQDAWCIVTPEGSRWGPAPGSPMDPVPTGRLQGGVVAAVFDGLGGHPNGRAAARSAAKEMTAIADMRRSRKELLDAMDEKVRATGGATTAVIAFVSGRWPENRRLRVVSVGDSAAYVLTETGRLERVNELDRSGRHELTDCLGAGDVVGHEVEGSHRGVVLVSDGVGDVLPALGDWGSLLLADPVEVAGEMDRLFKAVEKAGAPDNATLVVVRG